MLILPKYYRFRILNNTGVNISAGNIKLYARRFNFSSTGGIVFEGSESNFYTSTGTVNNGTYDASNMITNADSGYIGGGFVVEVTTTGSPNGNLIVYFESSTDGTTRVDTAGVGDVVAVINFTASGTKYKSFRL
jgi:hypothetical protein